MEGERCTLALWFTKDSSCDEDAKILNSIGLSSLKLPLQFHATFRDEPNELMWMPFPPSSTMYLIDHVDEKKPITIVVNRTLQSDLRIARLAALGLDFCIASESSFVGLQEIEGCCDKKFAVVQDALGKPIMLKLDKEVLPHVFANSIHALQVLQFCEWKEADQQHSPTMQGECDAVEMTVPASKQRSLLLHLKEWEHYMATNYNELQRCFPVWNQFKRVSAATVLS